MGKVIIFCRTYDEVTSIYFHLKHQLGVGFTEPLGAPDITQFRLVDMYTHYTHTAMKNAILLHFKQDSNLRIVVRGVASIWLSGLEPHFVFPQLGSVLQRLMCCSYHHLADYLSCLTSYIKFTTKMMQSTGDTYYF